MPKAARMLSIEDVDTLAAALVRFAEEAQAALADLDLELRRAAQWVEQDRRVYWAEEVRRGWDAVARARRELEQARLINRVDEVPSSCVDQKKALQRSQKRLELAMNKQEVVRTWAYRTTKQIEEYRGKVGPLAEWLTTDYPRALAGLRRMARALHAYVSQQAMASPKSLLEAVEGLASAGLASATRGSVETGASPQSPKAQEVSEEVVPEASGFGSDSETAQEEAPGDVSSPAPCVPEMPSCEEGEDPSREASL